MLDKLKNLVMEYRQVKELRMKLDKASKELKETKEADLQEQILHLMMLQNVKSVHYPEIGHVVKVSKKHYEVTDKEAFARLVFTSMAEAVKNGTPLSEAMLTQFRVSKESLEGYLDHAEALPEQYGVELVEKPELSIRK